MCQDLRFTVCLRIVDNMCTAQIYLRKSAHNLACHNELCPFINSLMKTPPTTTVYNTCLPYLLIDNYRYIYITEMITYSISADTAESRAPRQ